MYIIWAMRVRRGDRLISQFFDENKIQKPNILILKTVIMMIPKSNKNVYKLYQTQVELKKFLRNL